jgi:hypothetical protein
MEAVVVFVDVLCMHFRGGFEESREKPVRSSTDRKPNPGPPEYEAGILQRLLKISYCVLLYCYLYVGSVT